MAWREFELLAEQVMRDLAPDATVRHDDFITGALSGRRRQIDVSVRWTDGDSEHLLVIQCKDWAHPADITAVDQFAAVMQDVQAAAGILVCRAGFDRSTYTYARNRDIQLWNLHDATKPRWDLHLELPLLWVDLEPQVHVRLVAHLEGGDTIDGYKNQPFAISPDEGQTVLNPYTTFERAWNGARVPTSAGALHRLESDQRNLSVRVTPARGVPVWRPVQRFWLEYTVETTGAWLGHFTPAECRAYLDIPSNIPVVTHLPIGAVPAVRDERWHPVTDPQQVASKLAGTMVTTERYARIESDTFTTTDVRLDRLSG